MVNENMKFNDQVVFNKGMNNNEQLARLRQQRSTYPVGEQKQYWWQRKNWPRSNIERR